MPSPFPGMDPFIEGQRWSGCHHGLISVILETLIPQVRPRYVVDVEKYVYLEYDPIPMERRIAFLRVRERETREVITTIEVLFPINKRPGRGGRTKYLRKREAVLQSATHLVEIDLLRGGRRLPMRAPLPPGDHYAFVSREWQRPFVEVYAWPLSHPLPVIPVPLAGGDADAILDLQAIFSTVYDRAGYDYALDYQRPVEPPLGEVEAAWVQERLAGWSKGEPQGA